jgi:hypothetical protein
VGVIILCIFFLKKYIKFLLPLIILFDAAVMFIAPQLSAPRSTILDLKPVSFLQQNLGNSRFYSLGYIMPNYGSYYGIASINTNNEPIAKAWGAYVTSDLNSNVNPSQEFTGIDMLSPTGITPVQAFLANMSNYEAISVKYVVIRVGLLPTTAPQQYSLKLVYSDSRFQVYELPSPKPYFQVINGNCNLSSSNKTILSTDCAEPSTVLIRELYASGWTADINGKTIEVSKSGSLFQQINVPKGKSNITLNYTPMYIDYAYAGFAVALIAIIYVSIDQHWFNNNPKKSKQTKS